jgi:hypothetical protein
MVPEIGLLLHGYGNLCFHDTPRACTGKGAEMAKNKPEWIFYSLYVMQAGDVPTEKYLCKLNLMEMESPQARYECGLGMDSGAII